MNTSFPEPDGSEIRAMVEQATQRIVRHLETLPDQPASANEGGAELARSLREGMPERSAPFDELLALLFDRVVPVSFNTASPGYLAYVPGGGLFPSAVADLIACAVNRYVGVWAAAPGLVQLEQNVVEWFCQIVGFPTESGGLLTTGGSMANLIALITARRERLPENFLNGTLYVSDQTHHSLEKAAVLAGFPAVNVRLIPTDDRYRIEIDQLEAAIARDRRKNLMPFLLASNGGTTNTGAIDDLERMADIADREEMWLHCDAAYGGFFALTERGRQALRGLERSDSISLDPHKGLFLPYGNGSLLVRDPATLRRAHSTFADYMPPMQSQNDFVDFCQLSPELSRDFRGLRVWLPIKLYGISAFRDALDEKLDLALWAAGELRLIPDIEILAEPQLSTVAFRLHPAQCDEDALNELNDRFRKAINAKRRVYITDTLLDGRLALRLCILSFRTHMDRMQMCLEDIRDSARSALSLAS